MLPDERLSAAEEAAENERNDDDVVELSRDREEVGYEIEKEARDNR